MFEGWWWVLEIWRAIVRGSVVGWTMFVWWGWMVEIWRPAVRWAIVGWTVVRRLDELAKRHVCQSRRGLPFLVVQDVYEADARRVVHQAAADSGRIPEEGSAASYAADEDVCGFHEAVDVCNCPSCHYRGVSNAASAGDGGRDR
jgi:hypothetical protein